MGSCGAAAFLKKSVIAADIASDPLWSGIESADYRDIALRYSLRAAWSHPLISDASRAAGRIFRRGYCFLKAARNYRMQAKSLEI
jgi:hypothetical protein